MTGAIQRPSLADVRAQGDLLQANLARLIARAKIDDPADTGMTDFRRRQIEAVEHALRVNAEEEASLLAEEDER